MGLQFDTIESSDGRIEVLTMKLIDYLEALELSELILDDSTCCVVFRRKVYFEGLLRNMPVHFLDMRLERIMFEQNVRTGRSDIQFNLATAPNTEPIRKCLEQLHKDEEGGC